VNAEYLILFYVIEMPVVVIAAIYGLTHETIGGLVFRLVAAGFILIGVGFYSFFIFKSQLNKLIKAGALIGSPFRMTVVGLFVGLNGFGHSNPIVLGIAGLALVISVPLSLVVVRRGVSNAR
jgi:hypothetical protein